jgi:uncharacterized protein DUF2845
MFDEIPSFNEWPARAKWFIRTGRAAAGSRPVGDLCSLSIKEDEPIVWHMKRAFAAIVVGLLFSSASWADGFRCGTKLVTEGASRSEVASKCGEPTDVTNTRSVLRRPVIWSYGRPNYIGDDFIEIPVEIWVYNLGPNKLMRQLRFEGGFLVDIDTLGYGYN